MRTTADRIRHAISFEIIGILLIVPLGALGLGMTMESIGVVAIFGATIATLWNYLYNIGFDKIMKRIRGTVHKTLAIRIIHTILFEFGLLTVTLPFIAYYLGVTLWQALLIDIAYVVFYLIYAFIFNWSYDYIFPIPKDA